MTVDEKFAPFAQRMRSEGLPPIFIRSFADYYAQLLEGGTGLIPESEIRPVREVTDLESLTDMLDSVGEQALTRTVVIKLNGGLGTSMGLERAKSLLVVKEGMSFLDIIARQARIAGVPLVLMNSFMTHEDSLEVMRNYFESENELPLAFLQHRQPKISQADLSPVRWSEDPELEWCPPGHGDIYLALVTSGTLDTMLEAGYKYAFVSNSDNLGAVVDTRILGHFAENRFPFMMEVAYRSEMDKKGGHLAIGSDGRLILRELAQTPSEDENTFQDIERHQYFNTNNLWLNLDALRAMTKAQDNRLGLPLIRNVKTVDPRDSSTPVVYQLETAMGSAIGVFEGAEAIRVPRSRFAPVKTTDDLIAVRSDAYILTDEYHVVPDPNRRFRRLVIDLDTCHYQFVTDLDERFPHGVPSLVDCGRFHVDGDFQFGRNISCYDEVRLTNETGTQVTIPDNSELSGEIRY